MAISNGATNDSQKPMVFLFTWPRTASHLVEKILSLQPGMELTTHPMMREIPPYKDSTLEQNEYITKAAMGAASQEDKDRFRDVLQAGYDRMWSEIDRFRADGKRPLIHEHINYEFDPNVIIKSLQGKLSIDQDLENPEEYWTLRRSGATPGPRSGPILYPDTWFTQDVYTIIPVRHPAAGFPSVLRTLKVSLYADVQDSPLIMKLLTLGGQVRAVRFIQEVAPANHKPIVLDTDDLLVEGEKREKMMDNLYKRIEFEHPPQWTWGTQDESEKTGRLGTWKQSINNSTGIVAKKTAKSLDVDELYPKWVEEFGQESADFLKERVLAEIPLFEYLSKFKITADS